MSYGSVARLEKSLGMGRARPDFIAVVQGDTLAPSCRCADRLRKLVSPDETVVGRTLMEHPVELVEGAREVLETLRASDHELRGAAQGNQHSSQRQPICLR